MVIRHKEEDSGRCSTSKKKSKLIQLNRKEFLFIAKEQEVERWEWRGGGSVLVTFPFGCSGWSGIWLWRQKQKNVLKSGVKALYLIPETARSLIPLELCSILKMKTERKKERLSLLLFFFLVPSENLRTVLFHCWDERCRAIKPRANKQEKKKGKGASPCAKMSNL